MMDIAIDQFLKKHEIAFTLHEHPAVFTCEEAEIHCKNVPGIACKNLFLKDRKGKKFFLVIIPAKKKLIMSDIAQHLKLKQVKFASEQNLLELLQLTPGSVSILGLLHDTEKVVQLIIDKEIWDAKEVSFHPNINTASLAFSKENFHKLVRALRDEWQVLNL